MIWLGDTWLVYFYINNSKLAAFKKMFDSIFFFNESQKDACWCKRSFCLNVSWTSFTNMQSSFFSMKKKQKKFLFTSNTHIDTHKMQSSSDGDYSSDHDGYSILKFIGNKNLIFILKFVFWLRRISRFQIK